MLESLNNPATYILAAATVVGLVLDVLAVEPRDKLLELAQAGLPEQERFVNEIT